MAGRAELPKRKRTPVPIHHPPPNVRAFAEQWTLIRSPRFREVRLALEPSMVAQLAAEEARAPTPRPVLLAEDVARLHGKADEMIRATLAVWATSSSARLIQ
ncbi:MAG TPA: hypothetical protein VKM54_24515 [Myxococcota bacterium]|nr:hypothetical protein [Myxococcota bacterium]